MIDVVTVPLVLCILMVLWYFYDRNIRHREEPPGPFRWPLIGNLPNMQSKQPFIFFSEFSKKWKTEIIFLQLGSVKAYMVSDMREVVKSVWGDRIPMETMLAWNRSTDPSYQMMGMLSFGRQWQLQRKIGHAAMLAHNKQFKRSVLIEAESGFLMKHLEQLAKAEKPFVIEPIFAWAATNVILQLLLNRRFPSPEDEQFKKLIHAYDVLFKILAAGDPSEFLPLLKYLPLGMNKSLNDLRNAGRLRDEILRPMYDEHVKNLDTDNPPKDYVDIILRKRDELIQKTPKDEEFLTNDRIFCATVDGFFSGGTDTTANLLDHTMVALANDQKLQDKLSSHVRELVGTNRSVSVADMEDLPLIGATMKEMMRIRPPAPFLIPHAALKDTTICGYNVPKNTLVFPNVWRMHHDERYWTDPEKLDISRWIGENSEGLQNKKNLRYLPFGGGARECPGRLLAEEDYFVFLSNFLQKFSIHPADSSKLSELAVNGIIITTERESVLLRLRDGH